MYRFRLIDENGDDLGPFVSSRHSWREGDTIARRPAERLAVVRVVEAEEDASFRAYLVVRRT